MRNRLMYIMVLGIIAALALGACAPTPAAQTGGKKLKIGLVTDVGGVNDKSFNQSAWAGVQKAIKDLGVEGKFIESKQPTDYEKNIDQFATEKYDVIISVGFLMGDANGIKAKQYKDIKFGIIDYGYFPTKGDKVCDDSKKDCYADGGLTNVTSLLFADDEAGYLAGIVAGGMTKTGTVCTVSGMEIPPVVKFVVGFQNGAKSVKADAKTLNVYIPSFVDPAKGKEVGLSMIGQGCDVVFGVGGNTGNGGLSAAKEKGLMGIGVDVDQYVTYPEVKEILLTSAAKNVDVAVFEYLKAVSGGTSKAGIFTANAKNGGVGVAPYHDWDSKIPQTIKDKVKQATEDLKSGKISTGYKP
jgi:basic membrane protein A